MAVDAVTEDAVVALVSPVANDARVQQITDEAIKSQKKAQKAAEKAAAASSG